MNRFVPLFLAAGCAPQVEAPERAAFEAAVAADPGPQVFAIATQNLEPDTPMPRLGTAPRLAVRPTTSGDPTVGSTLTASAGTWTGTAPITFTYGWRRCDVGCVDIPGATDPTYVVAGDDVGHVLRVRVRARNAVGVTAASSLTVEPTFPEGTVCNGSGAAYTRPGTLEHLIVILMENRDASAVAGNDDAPYFNEISAQCGSSTGYLDNLFPADINSLSHYLALTSGSNCNTGIGSSGDGCVTDDAGPGSHMLSTDSIFTQVGTWRAYQEDMPSNCDSGNPAADTNYWVKHNPPAYYETVTDCDTEDIGIASVSCSSTPDTPCEAPSNQLVDDLANDTLPEYAFVTPDIENDMHDGGVTVGDNWLHTYLPLILASPAYLRGETAVYVLWDEQGSFDGGPIPNLFVSPYIQPTVSSTTMNHFAALRAMEAQLGIPTHLGCAGGTPPGGSGSCPPGSTVDLRSEFEF